MILIDIKAKKLLEFGQNGRVCHPIFSRHYRDLITQANYY